MTFKLYKPFYSHYFEWIKDAIWVRLIWPHCNSQPSEFLLNLPRSGPGHKIWNIKQRVENTRYFDISDFLICLINVFVTIKNINLFKGTTIYVTPNINARKRKSSMMLFLFITHYWISRVQRLSVHYYDCFYFQVIGDHQDFWLLMRVCDFKFFHLWWSPLTYYKVLQQITCKWSQRNNKVI